MCKITTLSNGKRVANFSSPHSFMYEDGSMLDAVAPNIADKYKVTFVEEIDSDGDVKLSFELSDFIFQRMSQFITMHANDKVDVVICPLPMITALRNRNYDVKSSPFRTIRVTDRLNKLISIKHQCL